MDINWDVVFNIDTWHHWLNTYAGFGPFPGIALAMLESFFPPLPLIAIVAGNAAAFGLWWGFLISWIGTFVGSTIVFFIFRAISKKKIKAYLTKYPKVDRFFHWVEKKGFTPIFMLYLLVFAGLLASRQNSQLGFHSRRSVVMARLQAIIAGLNSI